ncbi:MAG: hypothetical protein ACI4SC_02505 [Candidatus Neoclostridium sp.]
MKKLKVIALVLCVCLTAACFAACNAEPENRLKTPENVVCSQEGVITWDAVENADAYLVVIDGINYTTESTVFKVADTSKDYTYSVIATGKGYANSAPSETKTGKAYEIKGTLSAPQNVRVDKTGLVSWDAVENAASYVVELNGEQTETQSTEFMPSDTDEDFSVTVYAVAPHYKKSAPSDPVNFSGLGKIEVKIRYDGGLYSGKTLTLDAVVTGTFFDDGVTWSITEGQQYAEIDAQSGVITANILDEDASVTIRATSNLNPSKYAEKTLTAFARPVLTEDMLTELCAADEIAFEGYMEMALYTTGFNSSYYDTYKYTTKTAMDGEYWYSQYVDPTTGLTMGAYYKNDNGVASMVSVDFMNEECYVPVLDKKENPVSWKDSGFYNPFKGLTAEDFVFDEDQWMYKYAGSDETLPSRMVTAANPYDFKVKNVFLLIDDGAVIGIYATALPDYTVAQNYVAYNKLTAAVNYSDVVVEKAAKYTHDSKYDRYYADFHTAIENMRALKNYTTTFTNFQSMAGVVTVFGYKEYVTENECYFTPYKINSRDSEQNYIYEYTGNDYGFKTVGENLYNSYYKITDGETVKWEAERAYARNISAAKPTFAFSEEIFRTIITYENNDEVTFSADPAMAHVASTLYFDKDKYADLYGLFATGYDIFGNQLEADYITNVTIKDGYITKAQFYYYFDIFYGIVELTFGDFNETVLPESAASVTFEPRQVPSDWYDSSLFIAVEEEEFPLGEYFETYFGSKETAGKVPFFGAVLGDTFNFSMRWSVVPGGSSYGEPAIAFKYDVPLDSDRTLNSSITALEKFIEAKGFEKNDYGDFVSGEISIRIDVDMAQTNLDLIIYVWKTKTAE